MKKITLNVLFLLGALIMNAQSFSFMTYNIRYGTANDGENAWDIRKEGLSNQIRFYEPDILGVQEALLMQVQFLDEKLTDYGYYGVGRDDGKEKGEFSAIYFKKDLYTVLEKGTFWLSETPDVPSKGWDAALPRICTYMLFEDKQTKQQFWVLNTHFDHRGVVARKNAVNLMVEKVKEMNPAGLPVILMGDLNLTPDTEPIQLLFKAMHDARAVSVNPPFGPIGTSNGFDYDRVLNKRIDHIVVSKQGVTVQKYAVLTDSYDQKFYSDHLPVYIEATFTSE